MREIGSWLEYTPAFFDRADNGLLNAAELFASCRGALAYALSQHRIQELHVPSYYCPAVTEYLIKADPRLVIREYAIDRCFDVDLARLQLPRSSTLPRAFLIVDFFGKRDKGFETIRDRCESADIRLIVDRSHSIINDYGDTDLIEISSLRKLFVHLPIALLRGLAVAQPHTMFDSRPFFNALDEKARYLDTKEPVLKERYLAEIQQLERSFEAYDPTLSALENAELKAVVKSANKESMAQAHQRNHAALLRELTPRARACVSPLTFGSREVPAYLLLEYGSTELRDAARRRLVNERIYAPIHWSNRQERSSRVLSIPVDHRYTAEDMVRVAGVLNSAR